VSGRQLWMLLLCCGQRQQRHFSGLISVCVDHCLEAAPVHLKDLLVQVVLRNIRDPVCKCLVVTGPLN
jgi:hypothetical protein